jgi:hypothetical protein
MLPLSRDVILTALRHVLELTKVILSHWVQVKGLTERAKRR